MKREFQGFQRVGREIPVARAINGCFEKKPFESRNAARDWAARGRKKYGNTASEPYRCHICGLWHLTSLPKTKQAKARARDWEGAKA